MKITEVIGSCILFCMSVPYAAYVLAEDDQRFYSKCSNFIDEDHEYVSAYYLCKSMHPKEGMEKEEQLRQAMEHYQIRAARPLSGKCSALTSSL